MLIVPTSGKYGTSGWLVWAISSDDGWGMIVLVKHLEQISTISTDHHHYGMVWLGCSALIRYTNNTLYQTVHSQSTGKAWSQPLGARHWALRWLFLINVPYKICLVNQENHWLNQTLSYLHFLDSKPHYYFSKLNTKCYEALNLQNQLEFSRIFKLKYISNFSKSFT